MGNTISQLYMRLTQNEHANPQSPTSIYIDNATIMIIVNSSIKQQQSHVMKHTTFGCQIKKHNHIYIYIYICDIELLGKTLTIPTQMHSNENIPNVKQHTMYKTSSLLAQETRDNVNQSTKICSKYTRFLYVQKADTFITLACKNKCLSIQLVQIPVIVVSNSIYTELHNFNLKVINTISLLVYNSVRMYKCSY